jgi:hypothetical protein
VGLTALDIIIYQPTLFYLDIIISIISSQSVRILFPPSSPCHNVGSLMTPCCNGPLLLQLQMDKYDFTLEFAAPRVFYAETMDTVIPCYQWALAVLVSCDDTVCDC